MYSIHENLNIRFS